MPLSYIKRLNTLYEEWFERYDLSPTLVLESDSLDWISDLDHRIAGGGQARISREVIGQSTIQKLESHRIDLIHLGSPAAVLLHVEDLIQSDSSGLLILVGAEHEAAAVRDDRLPP